MRPGMNLILVTAGNYKTKTQDDVGAVEEQARLLESPGLMPALWDPRTGAAFMPVFHPEDDPMEKHDHPTASQRLGDTEAGLGAAATLTAGDAERDPQDQRRAVCFRRHPRKCARHRWLEALVHALHGDDVSLPMIRRAWTFSHGRFFSRREAVECGAGDRARVGGE